MKHIDTFKIFEGRDDIKSIQDFDSDEQEIIIKVKNALKNKGYKNLKFIRVTDHFDTIALAFTNKNTPIYLSFDVYKKNNLSILNSITGEYNNKVIRELLLIFEFEFNINVDDELEEDYVDRTDIYSIKQDFEKGIKDIVNIINNVSAFYPKAVEYVKNRLMYSYNGLSFLLKLMNSKNLKNVIEDPSEDYDLKDIKDDELINDVYKSVINKLENDQEYYNKYDGVIPNSIKQEIASLQSQNKKLDFF